MIKNAVIAGTFAMSMFAAPVVAEAVPSPNGGLLTITKVTTDSVTVRTYCPSDPPQNLFVTTDGTFNGIVPITCDGSRQIVSVPLNTPLTVGTRVDVVATVSGDSGEINDFGTFRVHR